MTIEKKKTRNVNISANFMLPCFFHSATHYRFSMHCHSNTSPPLLPNIYICTRTKINCGTNTFSSETQKHYLDNLCFRMDKDEYWKNHKIHSLERKSLLNQLNCCSSCFSYEIVKDAKQDSFSKNKANV